MGHTFPGATVPFGAVQLSPDTDEQAYLIGGKYNPETYKYCKIDEGYAGLKSVIT